MEGHSFQHDGAERMRFCSTAETAVPLGLEYTGQKKGDAPPKVERESFGEEGEAELSGETQF